MDGDSANVSMELVLETIDRNTPMEWNDYSENFCFTLCDDETVQISSENIGERDYIVTLSEGKAATCNCYVHTNASSRSDCRHMRAVNSHPQL